MATKNFDKNERDWEREPPTKNNGSFDGGVSRHPIKEGGDPSDDKMGPLPRG